MKVPIVKMIRGDRIGELEHLAKIVESLSRHLVGAEYSKSAYMALYDVRASLLRLGCEVPDEHPKEKTKP